jgi:hypothetical protein
LLILERPLIPRRFAWRYSCSFVSSRPVIGISCLPSFAVTRRLAAGAICKRDWEPVFVRVVGSAQWDIR